MTAPIIHRVVVEEEITVKIPINIYGMIIEHFGEALQKADPKRVYYAVDGAEIFYYNSIEEVPKGGFTLDDPDYGIKSEKDGSCNIGLSSKNHPYNRSLFREDAVRKMISE